MDITKFDKNFSVNFEEPADIEWYDVRELPFSLHGVFYAESEGIYRRMPKAVAEATGEGVAYLSKNTAGGRVRFATDSPYVAIKAVEPYVVPFSHMTILGQCGFSLYAEDRFEGRYMPSFESIVQGKEAGTFSFGGICYRKASLAEMTLFFPLYNGVHALYIGLKKGSVIETVTYKHRDPIVFYGSSITQGGCASKPGDDYISRLSMRLHTDIVNLGFSGSALAEDAMIEYLCGLQPSVFVLDYDHNAPNTDYLEKTHDRLYRAVRAAHPNTPIVLMSAPCFQGATEQDTWYADRCRLIKRNYDRAIDEGDTALYFVSGDGMFGDEESGTVDGCHPNSVGFYRMANAVGEVLAKLL